MDNDLGAGLYKIRIPRFKQGKSGGFRTVISLRALSFSKEQVEKLVNNGTFIKVEIRDEKKKKRKS